MQTSHSTEHEHEDADINKIDYTNNVYALTNTTGGSVPLSLWATLAISGSGDGGVDVASPGRCLS